MTNPWRRLWLVAGLVGLLVGCATTSPYERLTSDDCLVLVPTQLSNPDNAPLARRYVLHFDRGPDRRVENVREGYVLVPIREFCRLTGLSSSVASDEATGEAFEVRISQDLPYRPGELLVADFTFRQTVKKVAEHRFSTAWDLVPTGAELAKRTRGEFLNTPVAAFWAGDRPTP